MRCRACRARLKGRAICSRCGCDLSRALLASRQAAHCAASVVQQLLDRQPLAAAQAVERGLALQRSDLLLALKDFIVTTQQQCAVSHLEAGRPGAAWAALEVAMTLQSTPLLRALRGFIVQRCAY